MTSEGITLLERNPKRQGKNKMIREKKKMI